jgi:S1-C subfamily serine protease
MELLQIGTIAAIKEAELGMSIKKSGRTTGLTTGAIEQTDVTVSVSYGYNKTAVFTDQLLAGAMSQGGDSGSAVLDIQNNLVGLLYAGSETSTLINRIQNVFGELKISLPDKQD